jgi:hypothetical protein
MTERTELVERYLGIFLRYMEQSAPNSATADNARRAAESLVDWTREEERARIVQLIIDISRETVPEDDAHALCFELVEAIFAAKAAEEGRQEERARILTILSRLRESGTIFGIDVGGAK